MKQETTTYNGWTNYETWAVSLWLYNEEAMYRYWREQADRYRDDVHSLANRLKEEITEASPLDEASMYNDLLKTALSRVNWLEIAESWLEE